MITTILVAQVLAERYARNIGIAILTVIALAIFTLALALIFTWIGAPLPPDES